MTCRIRRCLTESTPNGAEITGRSIGPTLIYLHSSDNRQRALADAVAKAARTELAQSKKPKAAKRSGTQRAQNRDGCSKN
jgi:hypothetical protein